MSTRFIVLRISAAIAAWMAAGCYSPPVPMASVGPSSCLSDSVFWREPGDAAPEKTNAGELRGIAGVPKTEATAEGARIHWALVGSDCDSGSGPMTGSAHRNPVNAPRGDSWHPE